MTTGRRSEELTLVGPLDLVVDRGERVALVGPSGAGKSLTARLACLPPPPGTRLEGRVRVAGRTALLTQASATALDPVSTVGRQAALVARGRGATRPEARRRVLDVLRELGLPDDTHGRLPGALSGGQRQRAALALALLAEPDLLVADEPTSALDPVTTHEVVRAVRGALEARGAALLLVTHDPGVAAATCDRVVSLDGGQVVGAVPGWSAPPPARRPPSPVVERADEGACEPRSEAVLELDRVTRRWPRRGAARGTRSASVELDLVVRRGEHVAVLGRSGAGKSTLVRLVDGRDRPTTGRVRVAHPGGLQSVPQDAGSTLTPWCTPRALVAEALAVRRRDVAGGPHPGWLLDVVDLEPRAWDQRCGTLSGGQQQRVALARALAVAPGVLVGDEALAALDVARRARVADALREHAAAADVTLVLTTHDLAVARRIADRVVTLADGRVADDRVTGSLDDAAPPALHALLAASSQLGAGAS